MLTSLPCLVAATRDWGPYEAPQPRASLRLHAEKPGDVAWQRTQAVLQQMELTIDERKYGYRRFGAPKKPGVHLARLSAEDKQSFM